MGYRFLDQSRRLFDHSNRLLPKVFMICLNCPQKMLSGNGIIGNELFVMNPHCTKFGNTFAIIRFIGQPINGIRHRRGMATTTGNDNGNRAWQQQRAMIMAKRVRARHAVPILHEYGNRIDSCPQSAMLKHILSPGTLHLKNNTPATATSSTVHLTEFPVRLRAGIVEPEGLSG